MNEIYIRKQLVKELTRQHPNNTEFLTELPIANFSRRIDLVMANGNLSGFEIKSEQDTLKRLNGQLDAYTQYFERVTVVCATKHLNSVINSTPKDVGVWEFDGKSFISHRESLNFTLEKRKWISFLNVIGLRELLKTHQLKLSGLKSELIKRAETISYSDIRLFTLSYLKQQFPLIIQHRLERQKAKITEANKICDLFTKEIIKPQELSLEESSRRERVKMIRQAHQAKMLKIFGDSYEYLP